MTLLTILGGQSAWRFTLDRESGTQTEPLFWTSERSYYTQSVFSCQRVSQWQLRIATDACR